MRFGRAGTPLRAIEDVPRLTPLPNAAQPIVVFLGMRRDHATAVFLVSTDVHAQGHGQMRPVAKQCEAIELQQRRGRAARLGASPTAPSTQYELDLDERDAARDDLEGGGAGVRSRASRASASCC